MSQQIQITGGAKVRDLQDVIIGTSGVLSSLAFNVANGVPKLDSSGKILVSQLPNSVMEYLGTWDASTNTPTLANGTGNAGDVYLCNVAGTVNFGAGPISFVVSDQVIYSGSIWQKASGSNGTVTSVGVSRDGDALTITGSPITTSGTINLGFSGTSAQYINGAGSLTTFPTLISSIGLTMPSAFSVANSPLTANGTLAVTGAGNASQYIRGDGTLAAYNPSTGGGGSSQTFYFNGSVASSVVGYEQMSTTANTGTSTDFTISADGYIASFLTDVNSPNQLNIPAGNWNFEIYMNSNSAGGSPSFYVELYKYASSTFTLIATSSANPEYITNGTAVDLYTTALAVPATVLTVTDRLAVRVYVTHSSKTITMHTQDSNLSSVITTFSTGITALNGLTAQVQYFQTGTSGTDFAISSATATHTFNLPTASATNRGALSSDDWSTFNSKESVLTFSSPLVRTTNTISIPAATTSVNGYLTSTDWTTFNGKQNAINGTGFVKATGTTIYFDNSTYVTGVTGTAPVVSSGGVVPAISMHVADTYNDGYLSSANWNTFNSKASASGVSGRVAFYNGTNSLTSDSYFYFDSTYKNLGLGDYSALTIPAKFSSISTVGAWYNRNTSSAVYNGIGLYYDASYGHLFQTDKASTASEALITFVNNLSTFTISPSGYVGINTIAPMPQISGGGGKGLDIYGGAGFSVLALHNDASGTTNTDGARLYLTTTNVILRNYESGNLSILADTGDVILQAGGFEKLRAIAGGNVSITGSLQQSAVTSSMLKASSTGVLVAAVAGTDYGTVTSVAALTLGTTGTDLSSTVANSTTTPVITLNVPDASATARGVITTGTQIIAGIKTFNLSTKNETGIQLKNDIGIVPVVTGYTNLNGLSGGLAITNSVGVSNNLLVPSTTGYSYTFPSATGTIALTSDLSSYVPTSRTISTTAPLQGGGDLSANRTLSITQATTSANGYLSSTDWNTFNGKFTLPSLTSGSVLFSNGSTIAQDNSTFYWDNTYKALKITSSATGVATPPYSLHVIGANSIIMAENPNTTGIAAIRIMMNGGVQAGLTYSTSAAAVLLASNYSELRITSGGGNGLTLANTTGAATFSSSVTATSATFSGTLTTNGSIQQNSAQYLGSSAYFAANVTNGFRVLNAATSVALLNITNAGAATFSSSVTIAGTNDGYGTLYVSALASTNAARLRNDNASFATLDINNANASGVGVYSVASKNYFSGNVGIGNTPSYKLDVYRGSSGVVLNLQGVDDYSAETGITLSSSRAKISGFLESGGGTPGAALVFYTMPNDGSLTERLRITSGGVSLFGGTTFTTIASAILGATNPSQTGRNWSFGPNSSGDFVVYHNSGSPNFGVYLSYGSTSWTSNSDENIKDIIEIIPNAVDSIINLRAVKFYWKGDKSKIENIGLIAQDVEKVYPQIISKQEIDGKEILGVKYQELIPVLVKAIQELSQQNQEQNQTIQELTEKVNRLYINHYGE